MIELSSGFKNQMLDLLGDEAAELFKALDSPCPTSIKINVRKKPDTGSGIAGERVAEPVAWCDSGCYLTNRPVFTLDPLLHAGCYYVQDASSMVYETIAVKLMESGMLPSRPLLVADLCAAPGGKTTSLINALPDGSVVVANEFVAQRAVILKENISKWGYPGVIVTGSPVDALASTGLQCDMVAVDAPCSGEGMMRKDEDARKQWSEGLVRQCAGLQREILAEAVKMVREGGILIYSTCTFNRLEDEENLQWLIDSCGLETVSLPLAGTGGIAGGIRTEHGCMRFMPHLTRGEGLFVAVLKKPGELRPTLISGMRRPDTKPGKRERRRKPERASLLPPVPDYSSFTTSGNMINHVVTGGTLSLMTDEVRRVYEMLGDKVRILMAGLPSAVVKGRDWQPTTELVLSAFYRRDAFPEAALTHDEALAYLRHEALRLPVDMPKGFVAVTYNDVPLGLVKNIGNRANNLYPSEWRIRNL